MAVPKITIATVTFLIVLGAGQTPAGELAGASAPLGQGTVESYAVMADGVPA